MFVLIPLLTNLSLILLLVHVALTARRIIMQRKKQPIVAISDRNDNAETLKMEAMYDLIPQEYLETRDNRENVEGFRAVANQDEFGAEEYTFSEENDAQEMWRILSNPQGYQKALKVLGRVDVKQNPIRPSTISKSSLNLSTAQSRPSLTRSKSLHSGSRRQRGNREQVNYQRMRTISEEFVAV